MTNRLCGTVLVVVAAIFGQSLLAATDSEPNDSSPPDPVTTEANVQRVPRFGGEELASQPYRTVYSFSAVAFEVTASVTEVRHVKLKGFFPVKEIETGTSALPARWGQRLAEQLAPALADAAKRADIAMVYRDEMPVCPDDRNATVGRLVIEIPDIKTFPIGDIAFVIMQMRVRLTDNCDREIKSFVDTTTFRVPNAASLDEFLEQWLVQDESTGEQPSSPRMLADSLVAAGLLVWMPTWPAIDAAPRNTPYTLRALSPAGSQSFMSRLRTSTPAPVINQDYTLRWESLEELLAALGPAELLSRISNIRYELAVYREQANQQRIQVFRSADLASTEWNGSNLLESCESFAWSVRAHFRLDGFPRMTVWSALHKPTTAFSWGTYPDFVSPNSAVHRFRTPPPAGFEDCR